jgi:septal ring factor EnvC (AmiA/AmiB activator)
MNRKAIQTTMAAAAMMSGLVWCAAAKAGPLPLPLLQRMLAEATAELDVVNAQIARLESDLAQAERYLANLQRLALYRDSKALMEAIHEAEARVRAFKAQLSEVRARAAELHERIDWIIVQIEQWKEMGRSDSKSPSRTQ